MTRPAALLLAALLLAACSPRGDGPYEVTYRVAGGRGEADLSCATPGGGTRQERVRIPYDGPKMTFPRGELLYVSAQRPFESADEAVLTVAIVVDGRTARDVSAINSHAEASASMIAGME